MLYRILLGGLVWAACAVGAAEIAAGVDASAAGFKPLELDAPAELDPEQGSISFDYTPKFERGKGAFAIYRLFSCGKAGIGVNVGKEGKASLWFLVGYPDAGANYGIYVPAAISAGRKYRITATWTTKKLTLWLDGKMLGSVDGKGRMPFADKIFYGGRHGENADGLLGALELSREVAEGRAPLVTLADAQSLNVLPGASPLAIDVRGVIDPAQGSISFDYTPKFGRGEGKFAIYRLLSCGKAAVGVNRDAKGVTIPWFLVNTPKTGANYGVYAGHPLQAGKRYHFVLSWDAEQFVLAINGVTVGKKAISEPMPFGDVLLFGGSAGENADGMLENLRISKESMHGAVLRLTPEMPGVKPVGRKVRDESTYCAFVLESPATPVTALVRPAIFRFRAGDSLYVESSSGAPRVIKAERDGELELQLPPSFNNQIIISRAAPNLFPADAASGIGAWHITDSSKPLPTLGQGHEGFGVADAQTGGVANGKNRVAFDGGALVLTKSAPNGSVIAESPAVGLRPGQKYLLAAFYQTENMRFGSGFAMILKLSAPGKQTNYIYATAMARNTPPGTERMASAGFAVPSDWNGAEARILLTATGAPFEVAWRGFDLRERPVLLPVAGTPALPEQMEPQITQEALLAKLKAMSPRTAERRVENGMVQLLLDGKAAPKFGYTGFLRPGHKDFHNAGVKLQWLYTITGNGGVNNWRGTPLWLGDGKCDFAALDRRLSQLLALAPDATVMLYLGVAPYPDFFKNHPDALALDASGKPMPAENTFWQSYAAESYRRETAAMLRALAEHLKQSPYGKAVAGIHLVGGRDGQWFPHPYDGSAGNLAAFRDWLRRNYRDDLAALRKAWGDGSVTFETAALPLPDEFRKTPYFLDPATPGHRRLMDAERFRNVSPVETVELLAKAFKEAIGRPVYVSMYYNDVTAGHDLGKNALREVLRSPWIDGVVGVVDYGWARLPGFSGASVVVTDSPGIHGKILLGELDYRTECSELWDARDTGGWGPVAVGNTFGAAENTAQQRRDTGIFLTHGQGVWMYALAGNGWPFPELMQPIREALRAATLAAAEPRPEDRGDAAWFIDERMLDSLGQGRPEGASFRLLAHQVGAAGARFPFYRSGVKFDSYLLSDLTEAKRKPYRMYVFVSSPSITEEEIAYIEKNLQKDGNVLVFLFDAGRVAPGGFSDTVRRLTGIGAKIDDANIVTYRFDAANHSDPLAKTLRYFGTETRGPALVIDDPSAAILGRYTGTALPGAAVKRHKDWTGIYIGAPGGVTPEFLNAAACEAGIAPTAAPGDAVHAGNGFLVLHAISSGEKTLRWQGKRDLEDLANGSLVARAAESYSFPAKVGETRWFRLK